MSALGRLAAQATSLFKDPLRATRATGNPGELQTVLAAMARRLAIPGAAAAIVSGDQRATAATGVLNMATGARATRESLFLIGSISKVWTASLVMQLVDEGSVALDDPVRRHVPDLQLATDDATEAVTVRQLLTHTSGIEDDFTISSGDRGDRCIRRYVERLATVGQLHPVGAMYSYCNSGFVLAGEVIERVDGTTFDDALRTRVIDRLGLTDTVLLPEEALLRAVAVGHVPVEGSRLGVAPVWSLPRAFGPAGATIAASAPDLLRFAEAHLSAGEVGDRRLLSESSAREMQRAQIAFPGTPDTSGGGSGLGWMVSQRGGVRLLYHGGANVGQHCAVLVVPERELAIVALTNSVHGAALHPPLFRHFVRDLPAATTVPPAGVVAPDVRRFVGRYARRDTEVVITSSAGGLLCQVTHTDPAYAWYGYDAAGMVERAAVPLTPLDEWTFSSGTEDSTTLGSDRVVFVDSDGDGTADYVYVGLAAARRRQ